MLDDSMLMRVNNVVPCSEYGNTQYSDMFTLIKYIALNIDRAQNLVRPGMKYKPGYKRHSLGFRGNDAMCTRSKQTDVQSTTLHPKFTQCKQNWSA